MSTLPLVAVLLPLYQGDRLEFFRQALDSILQQNYPHDKVHLYLGIDGPLPSNLESYVSAQSCFHRVVRNEANLGLARTLNRLIDSLQDEVFVFRMDADDICLPHRFRSQIDYLLANPDVEVVGGHIEEFFDDPNEGTRQRRYVTDKSFLRVNAQFLICKANPLAHMTVCFRREFFLKIPGYPTRYRRNQDLMIWFEALATGVKIGNVDKTLVYVRTPADFFGRRKGKAAFEELLIYIQGIWQLHGITWRYIFPVLRFFFRMLPTQILRILYQHRLRKRLST